MQILLVAQPNSARRVEVSLAARGFRECGALSEMVIGGEIYGK